MRHPATATTVAIHAATLVGATIRRPGAGLATPDFPDIRLDCAGPLEREDRDPPSRTAVVQSSSRRRRLRRRSTSGGIIGTAWVSRRPRCSSAPLFTSHTRRDLLTTSFVITQWSWHCRIAGRGARIEAALGIRHRHHSSLRLQPPKAATRRSYGVGQMSISQATPGSWPASTRPRGRDLLRRPIGLRRL